MNLRNYCLLSIVFGFCIQLQAQEVKYDEKGQKILVFSDGTWRPYIDADSIYLKKGEGEFLIKDDSGIDVLELPEQQDKKKKDPKPTVAEKPISPKERKKIEQKASKLKDEIKILENKIYKYSMDPSIPESDLVLLRTELADKNRQLSELGLSTMEATDQPTERQTVFDIAIPDASDAQPSMPGLSQTHNLSSSDFKAYKDPILSPPSSDCNIANRTVDEFTRNKIIDLAPSLLFSYTPEALRPHLKGAEFLTGTGYINEVGPYRFLNMEFIFVSPTAKREYGTLQRNAALTFMLLNGNTVVLYNTIQDDGVITANSTRTVYKAKYAISPQAAKDLKKSEIDKVRVLWSTGFEDYEVFHVRSLMDQLNCLDKIN